VGSGAPPATELRECQVPGAVPRHELAAWRERFGVVAGITTRGGAEGDGFDLGLATASPVGGVMARWRALRSAEPGFASAAVGLQVHGSEVAVVEPAAGWLLLDGVDGLVAGAPGVLLTVTVADCIPVYLVAPRARAAALLHAGWRGTAAGILELGVRRLAALAKASPEELVMHCGVGICGACYEVGSEVLAGCGLPAAGPGPWRLDLRDHLLERARRLGVGEATASPWCSAHDRRLFYSHRASRGADGRMAAYLGYPAGRAGRPFGAGPGGGPDAG
jgi:copper oxidase (laccase) domain-containing protein